MPAKKPPRPPSASVRRARIIAFVIMTVRTDRKACAIAETRMDPEWVDEHTSALAAFLGVPLSSLTPEDIALAEREYRREASS